MASLAGRKDIESVGGCKVKLCGLLTLGAAGAFSAWVYKDRLGTWTRTGQGVYVLTTQDKWVRCVGVSVTGQYAGATPINKGSSWKLASQQLSPTIASGTAPSITLNCEIPALAGSAGVLQDPPDNAQLLIELTMLLTEK